MIPGKSLLDKSVRGLGGPNMILSLSFDARPSSMPRKCTDDVDERREVPRPKPKVSVRPTNRSAMCTLSVHILPAVTPRQERTGQRA